MLGILPGRVEICVKGAIIELINGSNLSSSRMEVLSMIDQICKCKTPSRVDQNSCRCRRKEEFEKSEPGRYT